MVKNGVGLVVQICKSFLGLERILMTFNEKKFVATNRTGVQIVVLTFHKFFSEFLKYVLNVR